MNKKRFIVENIDKLNTNQNKELIKIIENNELDYMKNNNGIFLSLNNIDNHIIDNIYEHIIFCMEQKTDNSNTETFQKDNLKYLHDFLNQESQTLCVYPPHESVIENKIKKNIIPKKNMNIITVNITDIQKSIIELSKMKKIM